MTRRTNRTDYVQFTDEFGREQRRFLILGSCPAHLDPKYVANAISDYLSEFFSDDPQFGAERSNDGKLCDGTYYSWSEDMDVSFCDHNEATKLLAKMKKNKKAR